MIYIINTITDWDEPPRNKHDLTNELSKIHKVFFINSNKIGLPRLETKKINKNITVIIPYWFISYKIRYRCPIINEIYQNWLFSKLKNIIHDSSTIINFDFTATQIYKYANNVIYYCNDDYLLYKRVKSILVMFYFYITERYVAKHSKYCISVYQFLANKFKRYNKYSFLIKLGSPSIDINKYLNDDMLKTKNIRPRIYFVGYINYRINISWVVELCDIKPKWDIYFIGPDDDNTISALKDKHNFHYLGVLTGDKLYKEIAHSDAFISPYREFVNKYSLLSSKYWLYFSFGKPIIACYNPNIVIDKDFIYQVRNTNEFINKIEYALKNDSFELKKKRISFALKNTWAQRVKELHNIENNIINP